MSKVVHDEVPLMCNNEICAGRKNNMHTLLKVMPIPADIEKNTVGHNHINAIYVMPHFTFVRHANQIVQKILC